MAFHQYGFFHVNFYVGLGGNIFHNGRNWRASLLYEFFDVSSRVFYEKMFFCIRCTQTVFHLCDSLHCDVSEYLASRKTWDNSCKEKFAFHLNAIRGVALVFPIENIWIDILCTCARKWLFFRVNTKMWLEWWCMDKGLFTNSALECFNLCMCFLVGF